MHVILIEIKFLRNLAIREVEPHEIQAQYPDPQGLMMASKNGPAQIVKASAARLTAITLTFRLRVVAPLFSDLGAVTDWTVRAV
jgi:hypothetical protein